MNVEKEPSKYFKPDPGQNPGNLSPPLPGTGPNRSRPALRLVKMSEAFRLLLNDMMEEWLASGENIIPQIIAKADYRNFETYVDSLEVRQATETLVPDSTFFCLDASRSRLVGAVNIRHWLNDGLLLTGGHIGDGVRPSDRGKGIATEMIRLALEECRRLHIGRVLMVCRKENAASARTIQKNGGVLENEVCTGGTVYQRYWIDTSR